MSDTYLLHWSANGPIAGTAYLLAGGGNTAAGIITAVPGVLTMVDDGTIDILQLMHSNPSGSDTLTYRLNVNEVDSVLTLALSTATAQGSNIVNTVAVLRGDRVRMKVIATGTLATLRINACARFAKAP